MIRFLVVAGVLGTVAYMAVREPAPRVAHVPASWQAPREIEAAPIAAEPPRSPMVAMPTAEPEPPTPPSGRFVDESTAGRKRPTVAARPAAPVPTSPPPAALAILDSPSAGLPKVTAVSRLRVDEVLPDGSTRPAGGPADAPQAPSLASRLQARPPAEPAAPAAAAVNTIPVAPRAASSPDTFLRNAARILAETELPK